MLNCKRLSQLRITPAWAGKRTALWYAVLLIRDHPRVGGEKNGSLVCCIAHTGSPPRGRGKAHAFIIQIRSMRITPAWAGKSSLSMWSVCRYRDHPRVGGEKSRTQGGNLATRGSPPRGRGKAEAFQTLLIASGITPAWAGKRLKRSHRSGIFISGPIPFHSVLHRPAGSGGSRAGRDGAPAGQPQNAGPA